MRGNGRLAGLLSLELFLLSAIAWLGDLRSHIALYLILFVAASLCFGMATLFAAKARVSTRVVIVSAIVLRLPMFFTQPSLSDDVWRYLHDGRAQLAGVSPYAFAPSDPRTTPFRGPEFSRINHPDIPTIYPPLAQFAFRVAAMFPAPLLAWRLILLAAEIALRRVSRPMP